MKPVVAIVSKQRLTGAANGSSAYVIAIANSLSQAGYSIQLIQPSPDIFGRTPFMRFQREMSVFDRHAIRGSIGGRGLRLVTSPAIWGAAIAGALRGVLRRIGLRGDWLTDRPRPYSVATAWKKADLDFVARQVPDDAVAVIADYMFCAPAFAAAGQGMARAVIMHDLFHARDGGGKDSVALVGRDEELAMLGQAQTIFAIQEAERSFVEANVPGVEALLVPMPAEPASHSEAGEGDRILFVGSHTAPNSVGLEWFFANVWPKVLEQRPGCILEVAGTVNRAFGSDVPPNVRFLGMVPDLDQNYRRTGVVISPLTFGSGLKIKLIEAMARGKAIVATSITLQGVEDECAGALVCTDDADAFAQAVVTLASNADRRRDLADKALARATRCFAADAVHRELRDWASRAAGRA